MSAHVLQIGIEFAVAPSTLLDVTNYERHEQHVFMLCLIRSFSALLREKLSGLKIV